MSKTFDCPRCGAPVHAEPDQPHAHCHYCQEDVEVPWAVVRQHHDGGHVPAGQTTAAKSGGSRVILAVIGAIVAIGAIFWIKNKASGPHDMPVTVSHDSGEDVEWDAANDPPIIAALNGREDFVGAFWKAQKGESRKDHAVYVGLFDGTSHERVWFAGPFGRLAQAKGSTHFGFSQGRVLATDYRGMLYAFDALTGKEKFSVKLPDRARAICTANNQVWVDVLGDRDVTVDVVKGTLTQGNRPAGCPDTTGVAPICATYRGRAVCAGPEMAPAVQGFKADRVLTDSGDGVAIGVSDNAKPVPMLVGYDQVSSAVRFKVNIPGDSVINALGIPSSIAELWGGRIYTQYELKDTKWRLACFDAKSGQRIWDIVVPGSKHGDEARSIALSSSRTYLSHGDWLDIFDIKTGGALGEFGR